MCGRVCGVMAQDGPAGDGQRQESAPPGGGAPRTVRPQPGSRSQPRPASRPHPQDRSQVHPPTLNPQPPGPGPRPPVLNPQPPGPGPRRPVLNPQPPGPGPRPPWSQSFPASLPKPGPSRPGAGFASGDVLDVARPGPGLAAAADAAAGRDRGYAGVSDDELMAYFRLAADRIMGRSRAAVRRRGSDPSPSRYGPCPGGARRGAAAVGEVLRRRARRRGQRLPLGGRENDRPRP